MFGHIGLQTLFKSCKSKLDYWELDYDGCNKTPPTPGFGNSCDPIYGRGKGYDAMYHGAAAGSRTRAAGGGRTAA